MPICICYITCVPQGGFILKLALLTLIALVPATGSSQVADPRLGSWTLISAQSTLTPPNTLAVTDVHGDVHVLMSGETHLDFTVKSDGHDTPVPGNPGFDHVKLHRIDKRQAEVSEMKGDTPVATVRESISKDANELTVTTIIKGHPNQTTVWTRSGGLKVPNDPLAGDWTEDLNKTRMQQGLTLKIEADGSNGVRFTGDDTYTAQFDGKPHDVRNSRNDTVTLQLADPHTVNAIYRRDDKISQRDAWTVSPNGRQMTLSSTATLENGQHLSETLVFKKQ